MFLLLLLNAFFLLFLLSHLLLSLFFPPPRQIAGPGAFTLQRRPAPFLLRPPRGAPPSNLRSSLSWVCSFQSHLVEPTSQRSPPGFLFTGRLTKSLFTKLHAQSSQVRALDHSQGGLQPPFVYMDEFSPVTSGVSHFAARCVTITDVINPIRTSHLLSHEVLVVLVRGRAVKPQKKALVSVCPVLKGYHPSTLSMPISVALTALALPAAWALLSSSPGWLLAGTPLPRRVWVIQRGARPGRLKHFPVSRKTAYRGMQRSCINIVHDQPCMYICNNIYTI